MKKRKFEKALIEIRPSKLLKGEVGIFAVRNLKRGTIIGDIKYLDEDLFFTWDDYKKIDAESKRLVDRFCITNDRGFYAPLNINYISIPWFINHCCDGNVGFDKVGNFITIRNVKRDEELCYDYGLAAGDPKWKLHCKCGSKRCRKIITGNDWRNSAYRKKNFKYMTPELKEIIKKSKINI